MSMRVISWEEYILGTRDWGLGTREKIEVREPGVSIESIACCEYSKPRNNNPRSPVPSPQSPVPSLAITIGVFDGVHLGHQALIRKIISPVPSPQSPVPTVVTFKQNPLKILNPAAFAGDILTLDQRLRILETLGVRLVVLIDFSEKFSTINGREFIDLLLRSRPVKFLALGRNFRCGCRLDTGVREIQRLAEERGIEVMVVPQVMDEGHPVSSSRIRQALTAGRIAEAERLLGRSVEWSRIDNMISIGDVIWH